MRLNIEISPDFLIDKDNKYIGLVIKIYDGVWVYILTENVHSWLKKFGDFYIGFQKEKKS